MASSGMNRMRHQKRQHRHSRQQTQTAATTTAADAITADTEPSTQKTPSLTSTEVSLFCIHSDLEDKILRISPDLTGLWKITSVWGGMCPAEPSKVR